MPFERRLIPAIAIGLADVFVIGLGMGIPVFAILLGFPVGWWLTRRRAVADALPLEADAPRASIRALLGAAGALAFASFVVLLVVWGPHIPGAFDPGFDAAEFGIPLILYGSQASMVGWLVLMLVISPVLQFMAVLTGGVAGLAAKRRTPREP